MKKCLLVFFLCIITVGAFAQLNFTFTICSSGTDLTGSSVLTQGDVTWTMENKGVTVTNAESTFWLMDNQGGQVLRMCDPMTDMASKGGSLSLGDVVNITIKVTNPAHPLYNKTTSASIPINSMSSDDYVMFCALNFTATLPTINIPDFTMCAGETGKTVIATITDAPADIASYTIDWGGGMFLLL